MAKSRQSWLKMLPSLRDDVPQLGAGVGRGDHEVGQVRVELDGELDRVLHRLFGLGGHAQDEEAHRLDAGLLAPLEGLAHHVFGLALLDDVLQDAVVAALHAEADALAAGLLHELEELQRRSD